MCVRMHACAFPRSLVEDLESISDVSAGVFSGS